MPMIDIQRRRRAHLPTPAALRIDAAATVKSVEGGAWIFRCFVRIQAAFVHELPVPAIANVDGDSN